MRHHIAVLALTLAVAAPAAAQQQPPPPGQKCGERAKIIEHLAKKYKEVQRGIGITSGGNFMEFYISPSGSWSALVTPPVGPTCLVEGGEGWEDIAPKPAGTAL